MKRFTQIILCLVAVGLCFVLADIWLHPSAYFPSRASKVSLQPATDPEALASSRPEPLPIPTPIIEKNSVEQPPIISTLSPQEAQTAFREGSLQKFLGARVRWEFERTSAFWSLETDESGKVSRVNLPVLIQEDLPVVASLPADDPEVQALIQQLKAAPFGLKGTLEGNIDDVFKGAPTGRGILNLQTAVAVGEVRFHGLSAVTTPPVIQIPEQQSTPAPIPTPTPAKAKITRPSAPSIRYEIQLVSERERNREQVASPNSAWSIRHTLYAEDAWILDESDYAKLRDWDVQIRTRFSSFENESDRQQVVKEFVDLLGLEKSAQAGIIFNDGSGMPIYRWPSPQERDSLLVRARLRRSSVSKTTELTSGPAREVDSPAPLRPMGLEAPSKSTSPDRVRSEEVLKLLLRNAESLESLHLIGEGSSRYIVEKAGGGYLPKSENTDPLSDLLRLLDDFPLNELILRVSPVGPEIVQVRMGDPDRRGSGVYPKPPWFQGATSIPSLHTRPPASVVWEVYGGVSIGRANAEEEGESIARRKALIRISREDWLRTSRLTFTRR